MHRSALALASLAVATTACLAVLYALREPPARDAVPAPAAVGKAVSRSSDEAAVGAPPPPGAADAALEPSATDRLAEAAAAGEAEEEALRDALLGIDGAEGLALEARLARWQDALAAARATAPDAPIFGFPTMLAELFLRMDSVQRELAAMNPNDRAAELARIRKQLGFDDAGIARFAERDERNESRWQSGREYMQDRARLEATFEGDALEAELSALRRDRFGDQAPTIEREERAGFYRFERPRIYGRN